MIMVTMVKVAQNCVRAFSAWVALASISITRWPDWIKSKVVWFAFIVLPSFQ